MAWRSWGRETSSEDVHSPLFPTARGIDRAQVKFYDDYVLLDVFDIISNKCFKTLTKTVHSLTYWTPKVPRPHPAQADKLKAIYRTSNPNVNHKVFDKDLKSSSDFIQPLYWSLTLHTPNSVFRKKIRKIYTLSSSS